MSLRLTPIVLSALCLSTLTASSAGLFGSTTSAPSAAAAPAAAIAPDDGVPRLRKPDGPPRPGSFSGRPPLGHDGFFPVGVWYESVLTEADVRRDQDAGINSYLELTDNSDLALVKRMGMRSLTSMDPNPHTDGYLLPDEVDMWGGPGSSPWTGTWPGQGDVCQPARAWCGYTVVDRMLRGIPDDEFVWGQFGKGVMMWQSREQAEKFVNDGPDGVSADLYWYTDPNICGISEGGWFFGTDRPISEAMCRRASNYGRAVERLRGMVKPRGSKPVWNFVELGHPFTQDSAPTIRARQIRDAVWSGLIHGARGVVYFNHNFGGDCQTQHVLRDACGAAIRPTVTRLNRRIKRLAPLLNADFVDGVVKPSGSLDVSTKLWRKRFYLIVGRWGEGSGAGTISLACGGGSNAVDIATGQQYPIKNGTLQMRVPAEQSVRILRLEAGRTCGLG